MKRTNILGRFPPEIRDQILRIYFESEIGREMTHASDKLYFMPPSLLAVLRPVPQLYAEALATYYELQLIRLNINTF